MEVEPKGLHVENPLGRLAPQLPCDCVAAFNYCKRSAFWRVPFNIFGKQRGKFFPVACRQGFIIRLDQSPRLFCLHEPSSFVCQLSLPDQYPTRHLLQALMNRNMLECGNILLFVSFTSEEGGKTHVDYQTGCHRPSDGWQIDRCQR